MAAAAEPSTQSLVRCARAFTMKALETDAVKLRPNRPRIRAPITPLAQTIFRVLVFHFENVTTGLCDPALPTIADAAGCAVSSVKRLLPGLQRAGYLTWQKGPRRRVQTRSGWRTVRGSNRYRITCPQRHQPELRRTLLKAAGGKEGPAMQAVVARSTPPSEEQEAVTALITATATGLRPGAARTTSAPGPDLSVRQAGPPASGGQAFPRAPPERFFEFEGKTYDDPHGALAKLLAALPDD